VSELGDKLIQGLRELEEALESGQPLEDRFRIVERRRITNPTTGETIDSRIESRPKENDDAV
tara:strand:+ start:54942 stop:55127 length:186 start_codon:yes stop_codon:yes gene_type:complete